MNIHNTPFRKNVLKTTLTLIIFLFLSNFSLGQSLEVESTNYTSLTEASSQGNIYKRNSSTMAIDKNNSLRDNRETLRNTNMVGTVGIDTNSPKTTLDVRGPVIMYNRTETNILYKCTADTFGAMGYDKTDRSVKVCTKDNDDNPVWKTISYQ